MGLDIPELESAAKPICEGFKPFATASEPIAATIAPLSVHKSIGGIRSWMPALPVRSKARSRNLLFAATPPAIIKVSMPVSFAALIAFVRSTSTTASWKDAATSARRKVGVFAKYLETAVFKPENEKSY